MLGTAIRQAREEKGMSQERLAEELGVSRQAVSKWEIEQSVPTPRNLEGIEAALDLPAGTLAELLKEEEREPSSPKISKKCILLTSVVGVAVLVMAFSHGLYRRDGGDRRDPGRHRGRLHGARRESGA